MRRPHATIFYRFKETSGKGLGALGAKKEKKKRKRTKDKKDRELASLYLIGFLYKPGSST